MKTTQEMLNSLLQTIQSMSNHPINHYVTPGLTSSLIGGKEHGLVRLFSSDRDTREWVTPHSHRFDFSCLVLQGEVTNVIFEVSEKDNPHCNKYAVGMLVPEDNGLGKYRVDRSKHDQVSFYKEISSSYQEGDIYQMTHDQIHSIYFSRDSHVIFFEGPAVATQSVFLEPWSNGKAVETFKIHDWMFQHS